MKSLLQKAVWLERLAAGVVTLALPGCSRAIVVESRAVHSDSIPRHEPGVPFYVKTEVYRQHSDYELRWIDVQLTTEVNGYDKTNKKVATSRPSVRVRHVRRTSEGLEAIRAFQASAAAQMPSSRESDSAEELEQGFAALDRVGVDPEDPGGDLEALRSVSNVLERGLVTDYSRLYYLNAKSTWFSVGKVSTEIGEDGSLSKADAESGGGLPELISATAGAGTGFLPISELFQKTWDVTPPQGMLHEPGEVRLELLATVHLEEHGYRYRFLREFAAPHVSTMPRTPPWMAAASLPSLRTSAGSSSGRKLERRTWRTRSRRFQSKAGPRFPTLTEMNLGGR